MGIYRFLFAINLMFSTPTLALALQGGEHSEGAGRGSLPLAGGGLEWGWKLRNKLNLVFWLCCFHATP